MFLSLIAWAKDNHDAIEALAAVGSLAFSVVLTISTIGLWIVTGRAAKAAGEQARLTRESVELGNKEFVATHRPKLRVRRFRVSFDDDMPIVVHCVVANVGESPARQKRLEATIMLQMPDGEEFLPNVQIGEIGTLMAGQSKPLIMKTDLRYDRIWDEYIEVRGIIEYVDDNGIDRETRFWRIYDQRSQRFRRKEDSDYEYED